MFYTCGPNEAMVVSGCCYGKPEYVVGGRVWVWPCIQRLQKISLNTITLVVESPRVYTALGVPLTVTGVAQVKIQGQNADMLATACEQFLGKTDNEIQQVALETLEGHQRAIMGLMTVEEIYQDRKIFSEKVFEVASSDLVNMGISVVSYTLKDIRDDQAYLVSLGAPRTAQVKRDARIGEATARKDGGIKNYLNSLGLSRTAQVKKDAIVAEADSRKTGLIRQALAEEQQLASRFANDIEIAKAKRDYEIKKALYDQEVAAKKASADLAYKLQAAKTKQKICEEEMEIQVIERAQQIALQEQEITRRERELEATVRRPAEAEKFRMEKLAEAKKQQIILRAEAEAQSVKLKGDAEAFAIEQKAKAEAEQMAKKAEAWREYKDAAMIDMLLEALPKIAAEVAAPLANGVNKMTMVSTGNGEVGAAKLTNEVMDIVVRVPALVEKLTGIEIAKAVKGKGY